MIYKDLCIDFTLMTMVFLAEATQTMSETPMGWPEAFMYVGCACAFAWLYSHVF